MIIYVDIDNTICKTIDSDYINSKPIYENINKINKLYKEGHTIIYWTARGQNSKIDHHELTLNQLDNWGCKRNKLISGEKPSFDMLIDDKAFKIENL
jgi:hypothetical protein